MSRLPLARAHRPQRFSEVLGQQAPIRALGHAAESENLASAYIFSGTRGIGKTTIARIFAKALNCEKGPAADCCGKCTPCQEITEGRSLDVLEMDAATHTGIDDIRELRDAAQYPPSRERHRIFIIDEAHQLSTAAWNGLLKVLEEPPEWCVFMFCTTEPHRIPPTIESRSLHFAFRSPSPEQIHQHLKKIAKKEKIKIDDAAVTLLVRAANGSVRDGLSALDQVRALAEGAIDADVVREALGLVSGESVERYLQAIFAGQSQQAIEVVSELEAEGQDLRAFVAEALEHVRLLVIARVGIETDLSEAMKSLARELRADQASWVGRTLDETESRLRQGGPARTLLDLATVRMGQFADLAPLEDLVRTLRSGSGSTAPPMPRGATPPPPRSTRRSAPSASSAPPASAQPSQPVAPATPPASAASVPSSPANGAVTSPPGGGLLGPLVEAVKQIKPALAAYLSRANGVHVDDAGQLVIVLSSKNAFYQRRLDDKNARQILSDALTSVTGSAPTGMTIQSDASDVADQPEPRKSVPREQVLDSARKDPLVRELFDRFGAVVVEGHSLSQEGDTKETNPGSPG